MSAQSFRELLSLVPTPSASSPLLFQKLPSPIARSISVSHLLSTQLQKEYVAVNILNHIRVHVSVDS